MATTTSNDPSAQVPPRRTDELLSKLADRVGAQCAVSTVFGAPVQQDGVTVIPVATGRFMFGGGGGADPAKEQSGEGGGGGGVMAPAGYIELKNGATRFVPVVQPARMVAVIGGILVASLLAGRLGRAQSGRGTRRRGRR